MAYTGPTAYQGATAHQGAPEYPIAPQYQGYPVAPQYQGNPGYQVNPEQPWQIPQYPNSMPGTYCPLPPGAGGVLPTIVYPPVLPPPYPPH